MTHRGPERVKSVKNNIFVLRDAVKCPKGYNEFFVMIIVLKVT